MAVVNFPKAEDRRPNGAAPDMDEEWNPTGADDPRAPSVSVSKTAPKQDALPAPTPPSTPTDIVSSWKNDGPLTRAPTGIEALDTACRGGFPIPWRVFIVGAPSAGKTFFEIAIADVFARNMSGAGLCVGILAVDEEPEDITVRLAQIAGFSVAEAELRDPETLELMAAKLSELRIRLYDSTHAIESAAADLAHWAQAEARQAALFIDSIQAVRSAGSPAAKSPREAVEANVVAMRVVSTGLRLLVVATSEANRASYRNDQAAAETNDLAAGAESRAIEFGAQTQLMLRTPKDAPDVIHVRIAKNRRARVGEFWLRLNRDRHTLTPCSDPASDPSETAAKAEQKRVAVRDEVVRDAEKLAKLLVRHPEGLGSREIRTKLKADGYKWGVERVEAALDVLKSGIKGVRTVDRGDHTHRRWCLENLAQEAAE